jgi:hypothetical protein
MKNKTDYAHNYTSNILAIIVQPIRSLGPIQNKKNKKKIRSLGILEKKNI